MRLTTHLLGRILLSGTIALLVSILWLTYAGHRTAQADLDRAASAMQRILSLQLTGLSQSAGLQRRFPEWGPILRVERPDGSALRLIAPDGSLMRSATRGHSPNLKPAPEWFSTAYGAFFAPDTIVTRDIVDQQGTVVAELRIIPDGQVEAMAAWRETRAIALPAALIIGTLCLIVWISVRRALKPAEDIMLSLAALEAGALDQRLGRYAWYEFDQIARACNALADSLAATRAARAELSRRLLRVQEEERRAIARDLHDEFAQHLSAVRASAMALSASGPSGAQQPEVARIADSATHLMNLVRSLLARLSPWTAGDADLEESLVRLVAEGRGGKGPRVTLSVPEPLHGLSDGLCGAIYRVVQEALTNARRHAQATRVEVEVARDGERVALSVVDDGHGADTAALGNGFGIAGMRERVNAYSGELAVTQNASGGLTLAASLVDVSGSARAA